MFAPVALVEWSPPSGLIPQAKTLFSWGRGDGHLGLRSINYINGDAVLPAVAVAAGASGTEVDKVAEKIAKEGAVNVDNARKALQVLRRGS